MSVIYIQIARNNYSHYWLITTSSDPPTPSDMVSCLLSLNIKWFSIQTEAHLADLHRKARHEIFSARARCEERDGEFDFFPTKQATRLLH